MCTAPYACQNVFEFQFKQQDGYDILDLNILYPILSHNTYDGTPQTCTSAINILWTTDAQTRRKLGTHYCVFNKNNNIIAELRISASHSKIKIQVRQFTNLATICII